VLGREGPAAAFVVARLHAPRQAPGRTPDGAGRLRSGRAAHGRTRSRLRTWPWRRLPAPGLARFRRVIGMPRFVLQIVPGILRVEGQRGLVDLLATAAPAASAERERDGERSPRLRAW